MSHWFVKKIDCDCECCLLAPCCCFPGWSGQTTRHQRIASFYDLKPGTQCWAVLIFQLDRGFGQGSISTSWCCWCHRFMKTLSTARLPISTCFWACFWACFVSSRCRKETVCSSVGTLQGFAPRCQCAAGWLQEFGCSLLQVSRWHGTTQNFSVQDTMSQRQDDYGYLTYYHLHSYTIIHHVSSCKLSCIHGCCISRIWSAHVYRQCNRCSGWASDMATWRRVPCGICSCCLVRNVIYLSIYIYMFISCHFMSCHFVSCHVTMLCMCIFIYIIKGSFMEEIPSYGLSHSH